ncbi:heme utilization protein [Pseudomonas sp. PDNC002]|uniref:heme utilization protein n=1 Tax=Pseudomonas sp. PDNC002 TaxID=2811422 RepID=UPI0019653784|nr:heme utilization protein [Pseudomonas sp. PDNC002]QRY78054.1 heme utilization protein [Pseudomonas sp. PDNC002]
MKPTMALKPLVFAVAAIMAVAVQADNRNNNGHGHGHDNGHGHEQHQPKPPYDPYKDPRIEAGASAEVEDTQESSDNTVANLGTKNTATVDGSLGSASGNVGVNVAAGDMNQQANAAALATADEKFIFGYAHASTDVTQTNTDNQAWNFSTTNKATLSNSANGASGNIGINVTAGNYNQQKNDMAAAVSGGATADSYSGATQTSTGNTVGNIAFLTYEKETLKSEFKAHGTYKGAGVGYVVDESGRGGHDSRNSGGSKEDKDPLFFVEAGTVDLKGQATYQVLVPTGWKDPVKNDASLTNSLNNVSGNVGANVAAGIGNQQSNSLSIAAGCKSCL